MAIIIGDIHGDIAAAKAFLAYHPGALHISLGDLVDSRQGLSFDQELACLELLLASDARHLWGNHDLAYLPERPWRPYGRYEETAFREQFQQHRHRFSAALAVDDWLLTHAGVAPQLMKTMPSEVITGGIEAVANWLNKEFDRQLQIPVQDIVRTPRFGYGPLFQIPVCRGGQHQYGGIFWFDQEGEQSQPAPVWPQIFGHSPVEKPQRGKGCVIRDGKVVDGAPWINLNAIKGAWIYDTEKDELVEIG
jgi:hypothetical protein